MELSERLCPQLKSLCIRNKCLAFQRGEYVRKIEKIPYEDTTSKVVWRVGGSPYRHREDELVPAKCLLLGIDLVFDETNPILYRSFDPLLWPAEAEFFERERLRVVS